MAIIDVFANSSVSFLLLSQIKSFLYAQFRTTSAFPASQDLYVTRKRHRYVFVAFPRLTDRRTNVQFIVFPG